jgi:serine/threonine protein kinase/tetratricopeptide (TPR) repeat protein
MIGSRITHYQILARLGQGGMGVVYKAEDVRLGRIVALKILADDSVPKGERSQRFLQEARAAASINHPNVCTIYDIIESDDDRFIVMEYVEGQSLHELIGQHALSGEPIGEEEVNLYALQIALALDAAHERGIIHCDIKSENIMVDAAGRVKVMDFGLARLRGGDGLSPDELAPGTLAYMAPERLQGGNGDERGDLFALGVVLYELFTGRLPFRGTHEAAMIYSILYEEPPPMSSARKDLSDRWETMVGRLLRKDPAQRIATARELLDELESWTRMASAKPAGTSTNSTELRLYISSPFIDLFDEHEQLIKKVFPEIQALCRDRGITFTPIDLRWGMADDEQGAGGTIRTSLEEIDRCRPYFIGILGDDYGYSPPAHEFFRDPELLWRYPWIEDVAASGLSLVDIEFRHGALEVPAQAIGAHFYFRKGTQGSVEVSSDEDQRLSALRQMVRESTLPVDEFRDPISLGHLIYDHLVELIKRDFPHALPPSPVERERRLHESFAASRRKAYIPNQGNLNRLSTFVQEGDVPLIVHGASGAGKSSLLAYWVHQFRKRNPDVQVIEHYVGVGGRIFGRYDLMRHVMAEIRERFNRQEELPSTPEAIEQNFANWLGFARNDTKSGPALLLILDGLDYVEDERGLFWLPAVLPQSVRLIISFASGTLLDALQDRQWDLFVLGPLERQEREAIVVRFMGEYRRALPQGDVARIAAHEPCALPLFLRTLLEELRLVGDADRLKESLDGYLQSPGPEELFQRVLERLEDDFSTRTVREVMSLLWGTAHGLAEHELAELASISRLKLSSLVLALDYHLVRREGGLTFFHDYLRRAVEVRYLGGARGDAIHSRLAEWFEQHLDRDIGAIPHQNNNEPANPGPSLRTARELLYQLTQSNQPERLAKALATIPLFVVLFRNRLAHEILAGWRLLGSGYDIEGAYSNGLEKYSNIASPEAVAEALVGIGWVLEVMGQWQAARSIYVRLLEQASLAGNRHYVASAHRGLGLILRNIGEYELARGELDKARAIFGELGDLRRLGDVWGNLGHAYKDQGDLEQALECYHEQFAISERAGNLTGMAYARGSLGNVLKQKGDLRGALEYYRSTLVTSRELGDRLSCAFATGNMGTIYYQYGQYDLSMECFQQRLAIAQELGERRGVAIALGNIGLVHAARGDFEQALDCHNQSLGIFRELGAPKGAAMSLENIAETHRQAGDYRQALENYHAALDAYRSIGMAPGIAPSLYGIARTLFALIDKADSMPEYLSLYVPGMVETGWRQSVLTESRRVLEESLEAAMGLGNQMLAIDVQILLARIEAALGEVVAARVRIQRMLSSATDDEQRERLDNELKGLDCNSHPDPPLDTFA